MAVDQQYRDSRQDAKARNAAPEQPKNIAPALFTDVGKVAASIVREMNGGQA